MSDGGVNRFEECLLQAWFCGYWYICWRYFFIFGKVIVPEIVIVSGLANVHCRFGRSAHEIFGLGAGTYT